MDRAKLNRAYNEGWNAFLNGDVADCTLYKEGMRRQYWYSGYYAAHIDHYIGPVLARWGLREPLVGDTDDKH